MRGKKLISIMLLISLIFSFTSFQMTFAEENPAEAASLYESEIEFLKKINILNDDFDPAKQLTKAELAKMAVTLLHPDVDFSLSADYTSEIFNDVPATHPYYSYIKVCKDIKIINGDYNGNFNPDNVISVMDAITIMANALGYTLYANAYGGYPSGYYHIAQKTGMLTGMNGSVADAATGDVMAKIMYNSLFADISGIDYITDEGISIRISEQKNLLAEKHNIFEYDAIVYDNGITALKGASTGNTELVIIRDLASGNLYSAYVNDTEISSYLGYRVKVFLRNNLEMARNEVVHFSVSKRANSISISSDKIINANASYVEYEESEDALNVKKINFGNIRPVLIFNGIRTTDKALEEVISTDGVVTFIDNDSDNKYDIVDVLSFNYYYSGNNYNGAARNIVVDSVTTINGEKLISCMLNPSNSLDLTDEDFGYAFTAVSDKKTIYSIGTYDVISISEAPELIDGKQFYFLTVNSDVVTGVLNSVVDNKKLDVDGNLYNVSSGLTSIKKRYFNNLVTGTDIILCIDASGKVAYSVSTEENLKNYAYLTAMQIKTEADRYLAVKLFTKEGEFKVLPVSSKVKIDDVACPTVELQMAALKQRHSSSSKEAFDTEYARPVVFEENSDGEIVKIDTDNPNVTAINKKSELYTTYTTIPYDAEEVEDDRALKAGFRGIRHIDYKRAGSVEGKFFITGETVIIAVPEIDTYGMADNSKFVPGTAVPFGSYNILEKSIRLHELSKDDENYHIYNSTDLVTSRLYDIQGYDIDPDTGVAGLVILRGRNDVISAIDESAKTNPGYVFLRAVDAYDDEAEKTVKKVYYTKDGTTELSATIDTDECYYPYKYLIEGCAADFTPYKTKVEPLRAGDLIRIVTSDNKITHIERMFAVAKDIKSYYTLMYLPENVSAAYLYTDYPFSKTLSEAKAPGEDYGMPFDITDYRYGTASSVTVMCAPVKKVNGSALQVMTAVSSTAPSAANPDLCEISSLDITDPSTYNIQYLNYAGTVTTVDISDDGKSVNVKAGSISDIVTIDEAGNIDDASIVFIRLSYYNIQEMFIINNLNKIPVAEKWWVEN